WYQTTSRPYVEWLRDNNTTDESGDYLYEVWEKYGKAPPVEMASTVVNLPVEDAPIDEEPDDAPPPDDKGCGCATVSGPGGLAFWGLLALGLAGGARRRR